MWPPLSVAALRRAYRNGATSPEAVVATVLDRIERRGTDHVWIWRSPTAVPRARVEELTRLPERPGDQGRLPLFGIPFAVKDNIDVAGLPRISVLGQAFSDPVLALLGAALAPDPATRPALASDTGSRSRNEVST